MLYRLIDEHLDAFLETAKRHADGSSLPEFVEQEFRDFLTCGVLLAHGRPGPAGQSEVPTQPWWEARRTGAMKA